MRLNRYTQNCGKTAFRALKSGEFINEDTKISDKDRAGKLFSLLLTSFFQAYRVGIFFDPIKSIKVKQHNRKANCFFK
jgi:hypothetical protein